MQDAISILPLTRLQTGKAQGERTSADPAAVNRDWQHFMTRNTDGFERIVHRVDGVETVTYAIGQGEPLVFLQGRTDEEWDWARELSGDFRIYCPQHPAFGSSEGSDFSTARDYAAHYELLFPALELDSFSLVGESVGAAMAAVFATGNPDDVTRLMLIAPEDVGEAPKKRIPRPVAELTAPCLMLVASAEDDVPKDVAKAWKKSDSARLQLLPEGTPLSLQGNTQTADALREFLSA